MRRFLFSLSLCLIVCVQASAADIYGLTAGKPDIKSAGPLAFGPDGVLFIGDPMGAAVFAVQTGDKKGDASKAMHELDALNLAVGEAFGGKALIKDIAVNPETGNVFVLAIASGKGTVLAKVSGGSVEAVSFDNIPFAKKTLINAPDDKVVGQGRRKRNLRSSSITDLAWVDGEVIVSGFRKGKAPSGVTSMVFPFNKADRGASLEIYHGAHGKSENTSAIQTFVPFIINGEPNLLAGFVCTPLVRFPVSAVESSDNIQATTIAELGNRNRPLDMIVYEKGGKKFLLLSNSARGIMKISTEDIEGQEAIIQRVSGGESAGQPYETIKSWEGVVQLDKLNETHAVILVKNGDQLDLKTVKLP